MWKIQDEITIVLCGAAGQGIQTVEDGLVTVAKKSGYHVFSSREYMSRVRGGVNSTCMRIASRPVRAFVDRIDFLMPLTEQAIVHLQDRISAKTVLIGEGTYVNSSECGDCPKIEISFQDIAKEIGNAQYSNIVSLGVMSGIIDADEEAIHATIANLFPKKGDKIIQDNVRAADEGYKIARGLMDEDKLPRVEIAKDPSIANYILLDGTEATALGALAGGCNFETFYPMSPSTGIATYLAQKALDFSVIVDQSEDEISVMNKAIGASFGGARALVTTSGGGFSLMNEGLSLCGATELPLVIVVGQRPGPATGMPTRTEQGELLHVLYAGSGEFPRAIFAPGTIEDEFYLTQNAFNIAEKFQIPVFLLPDQYIIDASYDIPSLSLDNLKVEKHFIKMEEGYLRYAFTDTGISPRGLPGYGDGLTIADGHTHSEDGHITEDAEIRSKMVEKYIKKLDQLKKEVLHPELVGPPDYKTLIVGWGSTYYPIIESLENLGRSDIAFLHFSQVYPVHECAIEYLERADKRIIIEGNSNAQFGKLLQLETGIKMDASILKYNGYCFSVEEITKKLSEIVEA